MNKVRIAIEPEPSPPQDKNMIETIESEPSPSSDETQWINDVNHSATIHTASIKMHNDVYNNNIKYTPFIRKMKGSMRLNQHPIFTTTCRTEATSTTPSQSSNKCTYVKK